jgi:enediyne polyketide synthase
VVRFAARPRVAIVGIGCRVPGAHGVAALRERADAAPAPFELLPSDRWDAAVFADELPAGAARELRGAVLDDFDVDWRGLKMPPLQLERMHRMEKLALGTMSEALGDAGIRLGSGPFERGQIFVAASTLAPDPSTDHGRRIRRFELQAPVSEAIAARLPQQQSDIDELIANLFNLAAPPIDPDSMLTSASLIAGRVSHLFDFRGGHAAIDVGFSSSLAAIERATAALATDACDVALVAALSPLLTPSALLAFAHRRYLTSGVPRPFAADGDGTLLGEGCIALVLRRAADVGRSHVYACIDAVASVTPSRRDGPEPITRATREATLAALEAAACAPGDIAFVESRAAGIAEADQAEAAGLTAALTRLDGALPLRSTVEQFGFLQAASGMLALVRAALTLDQAKRPQRAGVSDVGLGAPAYHAVLSSAVTTVARVRPRAPRWEDGVALVGCGLVVPRANDVASFWGNITANVDALGDLPRSRWDMDKLIGASHEFGAVVKTRLAGVVSMPPFDPARFGIPPASASALDPSVILSLLATEQALADARYRDGGWNPRRVQVLFGQLPLRAVEMEAEKRVLFAAHLHLVGAALREAGVGEREVADVVAYARACFDRESGRFSPETLCAFTGATTALHVAGAWGFSGPAFSIDAACASSLAALRMGAESLLLGESDVVVAGGVAANLLPEYYIALSMLGFLSPDGAPPFDAASDGFVPAEGAGVVVLKRLGDALAARDHIYAVVRGVGCSSDGKGLAVYAPSAEGQQRSIRRALEVAHLSPDAIDLLEAHGAGTKLGDRTELESYAAVYGARDGAQPLSVGTVKSHIGHLSSAAGIVGVVKAALALEHKVLPPTADARPSPELPLGRAPLELATEPRPWVAPAGGVRRAAVSAFGLGGVNYHVLLEEHAAAAGERRAQPAAEHPAKLPARGTFADRFVVELQPVSLPARPARFSLRGRRAAVVADGRGRAEAIAEQLRARGAMVTLAQPDEAIAADVDVLVDCSLFSVDATLVAGTPAAVAARLGAHAERAFARVQAVYPRFADARPLTVAYVAVTALGGGLGVLDGDGGDLLGASLLGLAKGLKQELPHVVSKAIDFDPEESPETVAEVVLRELEDGNDRMEVGWMGRRMAVNLRRESFAADAPVVRPLGDGDVFVFSGGGRGVAFECACALARLGARVVVSGRTPRPDPGLPWLGLDDDRFDAFRCDELERQRVAEPRLTPARFAERFAALERQRELHRNLVRAEEQRLPLSYEPCDITNAAEVAAMIDRVRRAHGRIDGVAHAAMVEWSRSLSKKSPDLIARTLATKALGVVNLLEATREDRLRLFVCFGSGAGRFGNRGQVDYSAANALMAALLPARARRLPRPPHVVTIDWTAWQDVGAAVANPDIAALVKATGVTSIRSEEGVYWFLSELALGRATETVIFEERMLHEWPFLGARAEGAGESAVELDDRGVPLVPGQWPLVDFVLERRRGRVQFERRLDLQRDVFLDQHRLHGTPIVPATFGVEIMAEAAALCSPGWRVDAGEEIRIGVPVKLFREAPLLIRASARVVEERADARVVLVETRSHLFLKGRALQERLHHTGRFVMRRGRVTPTKVQIPDPEGVLHARSFFHMAKDPVSLGPLYCRAEWIQVLDEEVIGMVRAPRQRDAIRDTSYPRFVASPLLMDAAFQIAANWDGHKNRVVSIPLAVGALTFGRAHRRSENARVHARVVRVDDPDVFYDLRIAAEDGDLLLEIRGLQLRRIAHLEHVE